MAKVVKRRKVEITVKEETAKALKMSVEEVIIRVKALMKRHHIDQFMFITILFENKKPIICTNGGNIECDKWLMGSEMRPISANYTVGNNLTGHRLPACSSGARW
jgi:hypothetical protein